MQTIEEVKKHCRAVGEGIAAAVAAGEDLGKRFEGGEVPGACGSSGRI